MQRPGEVVLWHDLECSSSAGALPLWRELAAAAPAGPILDVGAGTGRVALDLAARGPRVVALGLAEDPLGARRAAPRAWGGTWRRSSWPRWGSSPRPPTRR